MMDGFSSAIKRGRMDWALRRVSDADCGAEDVVIWWLDSEIEVLGEVTAEEGAALGRMVAGEVRETRRRARVGVRRILAGMAGVDPLAVEIERGDAGKPRWVGGNLEFSLSHSGGEIVVAVSRSPVGVDIEAGDRSRPWLEMARRYFPEVEAKWLAGLPGGEIREAFLEMWVSKEAGLKCAGTGLAGYLERAVCRGGTGGIQGIRGVGVDGREFAVRGFDLGGRGVGAVAWEGGGRRVSRCRVVW